MWYRLKDLWQHNRIALLAFVAILCLAGFFGVRSVSQFIYWADPRHQDQPLAGWMTPRYVGQSYSIPPEIVQQAFDIVEDGPPRRMTLDRIAAEQGITLDEMQARVEAAVQDWRDTSQRPDQ